MTVPASAAAGAIVFVDATVVDGTGEPGYPADVTVRDGRIASIRRTGTASTDAASAAAASAAAASTAAATRIDAAGLVLAPGFIDMHAHSDLAVIADRDHSVKLAQGVTTEVIGQDGLGYAPLDDNTAGPIRRQIAGWNGYDDLEITWRTVGEYLDRLDAGTPVNTAVLVPQGNLRAMSVGYQRRAATAAEVADMRAILRDGLAAGAVGLSSGLTYAPGMYADADELVSLCSVVGDAGGFWSVHTRSYGHGALAAFAETIRIAGDAGCALHLTHATLNFAANRDTGPAFLAMIDAALDDGIDLTLDSYPYLPGATTLAALLPSSIAEGGPDALLGRLRAGTGRDELAAELAAGSDGFHGESADWSLIAVAGVRSAALEPYVGRRISEIAQEEGRDPLDVVIGILIEDELATSVLMHIGHEHNVRAVMRHSMHTGGSDGILTGSRPHPRGWGTFPRYLGHYVREAGVLSLPECVRHLSGTPARRLGFSDRGLVREGFAADLVLFDPATVHDTATFDAPRNAPEGIRLVMVNGAVAVDAGRRTTDLSGHVLRSDPNRSQKGTP